MVLHHTLWLLFWHIDSVIVATYNERIEKTKFILFQLLRKLKCHKILDDNHLIARRIFGEFSTLSKWFISIRSLTVLKTKRISRKKINKKNQPSELLFKWFEITSQFMGFKDNFLAIKHCTTEVLFIVQSGRKMDFDLLVSMVCISSSSIIIKCKNYCWLKVLKNRCVHEVIFYALNLIWFMVFFVAFKSKLLRSFGEWRWSEN